MIAVLEMNKDVVGVLLQTSDFSFSPKNFKITYNRFSCTYSQSIFVIQSYPKCDPNMILKKSYFIAIQT